jgi:hypothetical protein
LLNKPTYWLALQPAPAVARNQSSGSAAEHEKRPLIRLKTAAQSSLDLNVSYALHASAGVLEGRKRPVLPCAPASRLRQPAMYRGL